MKDLIKSEVNKQLKVALKKFEKKDKIKDKSLIDRKLKTKTGSKKNAISSRKKSR